MSIEDEIAAVKAAAEKKLRRLRDRERKHQQAVNARVLNLLRRQHADLTERLAVEARAQIAAERTLRSMRARSSRPLPLEDQPAGGDSSDGYKRSIRSISQG
ncbi:hypothetical protein ACLRGI_14480 [Paenarthrobacter nitroguajacolicus]|uniref:hypothetical protein n=1 Tax=Paenarthrobacter nitroguajacolicus TaxID=211146 RepID=UPI003AE2920B